MVDCSEVLWTNPEATEFIIFVSGYYKLMSRQEMKPLGRNIDEVSKNLKLLGRNDILESIQ